MIGFGKESDKQSLRDVRHTTGEKSRGENGSVLRSKENTEFLLTAKWGRTCRGPYVREEKERPKARRWEILAFSDIRLV